MEHKRELKRLRKELGDDFGTFKHYDVILAGGAITSLFTANQINDFDLFFETEKDRRNLIERFGKYQKYKFLK